MKIEHGAYLIMGEGGTSLCQANYI